MPAPTGHVTRVGYRELRSRTSRLASLQPGELSAILSRAESGDVRDFADLCDRMTSFDGHIRANYGTRIAQVGGAAWDITPGESSDPARQAVAEDGARFAARALGDLDVFEQASVDLLDGIGVGWAVVEIDWGTVEGAEVPVDLRWLHPRRFTFGSQWEIRLTDTGWASDYQGIPLSDYPDKFIVHKPRLRGAYPGTAGVLRACAWPYLFRRWTTEFALRGFEKFAWPTLVAKVQRGAGEEVRAAMKDALRDAANDHYLVTEVDQSVEMLETLVKDAGSYGSLDESLKAEIAKAILGSTDQSEPIKVGAWKSVESRKGTTVDSRAAIDEYQLRRTVRGQLLEPMMRFNAALFGGVVPPTPEIRWQISGTRSPISQPAITAGAVTLDELREREGLPRWGGERGARIAGQTDATEASSSSSAARADLTPSRWS